MRFLHKVQTIENDELRVEYLCPILIHFQCLATDAAKLIRTKTESSWVSLMTLGQSLTSSQIVRPDKGLDFQSTFVRKCLNDIISID